MKPCKIYRYARLLSDSVGQMALRCREDGLQNTKEFLLALQSCLILCGNRYPVCEAECVASLLRLNKYLQSHSFSDFRLGKSGLRTVIFATSILSKWGKIDG